MLLSQDVSIVVLWKTSPTYIILNCFLYICILFFTTQYCLCALKYFQYFKYKFMFSIKTRLTTKMIKKTKHRKSLDKTFIKCSLYYSIMVKCTCQLGCFRLLTDLLFDTFIFKTWCFLFRLPDVPIIICNQETPSHSQLHGVISFVSLFFYSYF